MKIIVDAMGGDNAPESAVWGGALAAREYGEEVADTLMRYVWEKRHEFHYTGRTETPEKALQAALDGWNREQDAQAAGELLFAAANAMRLAGVDAEEALTFASKRYCAELLAQKEQSGTQVE